MRKIARLAFAFVLGLAQSQFAAAKVEIVPNDKHAFFEFVITEKITAEDALMVELFFFEMSEDEMGLVRVLANLNSVGGSVEAAMEIGRVLRKVSSMAVVHHESQCLSSCVYVLAGAKRRAVDGAVGVHRPYEPDARLATETSQEESYRKLERRVKDYLAEVNIPVRLYDDSIFISPDRIKILSEDELEGYGLNQNDPFVDEADAVKEARRLGITRGELASRTALANRSCPWDGTHSEKVYLDLIECRRKHIEGR